jgi:DNA-binding LacI/PurR family transcriptional regulator
MPDVTMSRYSVLPEYWRGDGIITFLLPEQVKIAEKMQQLDLPIVTLNSDAPVGVCGAQFDHRTTGRMIAEYFIRSGFEQLAFFRCSDIVDIRERQDGFCKLAADAGKKCEIIDWRPGSRGQKIESLAKQIAKLKKPIGIMSQSDHRTPQLFEACERAGCSIPDEVSIVGVDREMFPDAVESTHVLGEITSGAAAETGLRTGTPVVVGAGDGAAAAVGVGSVVLGTAYRLPLKTR